MGDGRLGTCSRTDRIRSLEGFEPVLVIRILSQCVGFHWREFRILRVKGIERETGLLSHAL